MLLAAEINSVLAARLQVDSVSWVGATALLVNSRLTMAGAEEPIAPQCMVTWQGAGPAAGGLALSGVWAAPAVARPGCRGVSCLDCACWASSPLPHTHTHPAAANAEFFAPNIAEFAADRGPWLHAVTVPEVRPAAGSRC